MGCGSSKSKPIGDAPPPNVPQPLVQTGGDPLAVFDTFEYSIDAAARGPPSGGT